MRRALEAKFHQLLGPALPIRLSVKSELHLARKAWHMMMGILIVVIYLAGIPKHLGILILGGLLAFDLFMETARLRSPALNERILRLWGPLMRSCEINKMSGLPYYLAASLLAIAIFPKTIAVLAILYLACGDPIASLVGIRFGHRSLRLPNGKSLVGTLAGVGVCAAITWVVLQSQGLEAAQVGILTAVGAAAGGAAEVLPLEVDDNFSIPIVSGFSLWLAFILLSI